MIADQEDPQQSIVEDTFDHRPPSTPSEDSVHIPDDDNTTQCGFTPSLPETYRTVKVAPENAPWWRKLGSFTGIGFMVAVGYMDPGNWATDVAARVQVSDTTFLLWFSSPLSPPCSSNSSASSLELPRREISHKSAANSFPSKVRLCALDHYGNCHDRHRYGWASWCGHRTEPLVWLASGRWGRHCGDGRHGHPLSPTGPVEIYGSLNHGIDLPHLLLPPVHCHFGSTQRVRCYGGVHSPRKNVHQPGWAFSGHWHPRSHHHAPQFGFFTVLSFSPEITLERNRERSTRSSLAASTALCRWVLRVWSTPSSSSWPVRRSRKATVIQKTFSKPTIAWL